MRSTPLVFLLAFAACRGAQTPAPVTPTPDTARRAPVNETPVCESAQGGMTIEGMLGTLPQRNIRQVMGGAESEVTACYTRRQEAVAPLAGRVAFKLRVATDGSVRWAIPTTSTLGDREAEECMMQRLGQLRFERPCNGEAEVSWSVELAGGEDARPATEWPASRLDAVVRQHQAALHACRRGSTDPVSVTLYAAPDGTVAAAGASVATAEAVAVTACIVREVRGWRLPSPGSWFARATIEVR